MDGIKPTKRLIRLSWDCCVLLPIDEDPTQQLMNIKRSDLMTMNQALIVVNKTEGLDIAIRLNGPDEYEFNVHGRVVTEDLLESMVIVRHWFMEK